MYVRVEKWVLKWISLLQCELQIPNLEGKLEI